MQDEFEGRVAIVTGASSGIGRSVAQMLAARGARVGALARSAPKLEELAAASPETLLSLPGDAAEEGDVEKAFRAVEKRFGTVEILINNAGMVDPAPLHQLSVERWDRLFAVNVRSAFLFCKRAIPGMIKKGGGAIVNVSSISGVTGPEKFPGFVSYNASKAALIAFTEALAVEWKDQRIRVNCVSPGSVDTPMWKGVSGGAPAAMTAQEVAETILFLASERSRPINGQNLHVYSA